MIKINKSKMSKSDREELYKMAKEDNITIVKAKEEPKDETTVETKDKIQMDQMMTMMLMNNIESYDATAVSYDKHLMYQMMVVVQKMNQKMNQKMKR